MACRALASAEDQQGRVGIRRGLAGDVEKCLPHRHAGDFGVAEVSCRLLEMNRRAETQRATTRLANPGTTLGSNARVGIPFRIAASMAGPEAYPPTPITTSGRNSARDSARIPDRAGKVEQSLQPGLEADLVQRADLDQSQRKSGGGNQPVLDSARRADEQDFRVVLLLEFLGDGKRGDYVSAGAAACQNCPHQ